MKLKHIYNATAGIALGVIFLPLLVATSSAATIQAPLVSIASGTATLDPYLPPPDISKITVNPPDANGYAVVSGAAGAVPANVSVAIINQNTRNINRAVANNRGAFQATLFSPPGSTLLVKYSPQPDLIDLLWEHSLNPGGDFSYINPLPGASLYLPGPDAGPSGTSFHSAGYFGAGEGPEWAGWWIAGTVDSDMHVQPGAILTVSGNFSVTSPALNCSSPLTFSPLIHFHLRDLFAANGRARLGGPWFSAYLFTPTGLPIEHEGPPETRGVVSSPVTMTTCNDHTAHGTFSTSLEVPPGLASGTYKLEAFIQDGGVPLASGVRMVVVWYHFDPVASLPLLTVGSPAAPNLPWTLFADYLSNGHRGLQAEEDQGKYQMVTRTIYPPHQVVLPMLDPRSGEHIKYRLEPGSSWISSTDRRFPLPPQVLLKLPGGSLQARVHKPDGSQVVIGPFPIKQSAVKTPSLPDGNILHEGTGHVGDTYHLYTGKPGFGFTFDQYGEHTIQLSGFVEDIYGNEFPIDNTFQVTIARVLDIDPAQLPTTPYQQGNSFAPGLHLFPPVPADIEVRVVHMPYSNPGAAITKTYTGKANRFGYFQPSPGGDFTFDTPGEFRVDISAEYSPPGGTHWAGYVTWGNVVAGSAPLIEAHGRRGMDYHGDTINDMPIWFRNQDLPVSKIGIENYYPYFSGDIHWGEELAPAERRGDSIHSIITLKDLTGTQEEIYNLIRAHYPRAKNDFRWPPEDQSLAGLEKRLDIHEAPLFITTTSGRDPTTYPGEIDMWGYYYASSERPDVHVREIITEDGMGTAYWRFNDTYAYQIGEPADGDQPGDIKWEFGGVVFRVPGENINQYAIYSSLWVLLPEGCDAFGCTRVTAPFSGATGAGINGGPILTLQGEDINMLFLPKSIRPGDVLEVGDTVAFSGHVGPPLDSRVQVTITSPTGATTSGNWHANKIGWLYDPAFDFIANEPGRWTVDVNITHDRPYIGNGNTPTENNTGTVLGTSGRYAFYVVEPGSDTLPLLWPLPGFIPPPTNLIHPLQITGIAPPGTTRVYYTIHDKGIVMGTGSLTPGANGFFSFKYDPEKLHNTFSMLSLTAHEGRRKGLADEVSINILAVGDQEAATTVTLIGEEIFVDSQPEITYLPVITGQ